MPNKTGLATGVRVRGEQQHYRLHQYNGRNRMWVNDGKAITNGGIKPWKWAITTTVLASNVVTITTATAHGLAVGATVKIWTYDDGATYNGRYVIASIPTSTTFTFAETASNVASASNGGTVTLVPTVSATGAGFTGTYRYFVAPINDNKQLPESRVVSGNPSEISDEITVNGERIVISGIPSTHEDSQVTHWALYRNQTGNYDSFAGDDTQDFWLVAKIAIGTKTYTDKIKDSLLPPIAVSFRNNVPPTAKAGRVVGGRLVLAGFDPITTGTATVNATTTLIDFASVTLPDGIEGCMFKKDGDDIAYAIREIISTTQIAIDRPFSGTLSGDTYSIYRNSSELWPSEFENFEAAGLDGESRRNRMAVGGPGANNPVTAIETLGGALYAFTANNIYRMTVTGVGASDMHMSKDPVVEGIGCVGFDAVWREGGVLYFLSPQLGPMAFDGSAAPTRIGLKLGLRWRDEWDLNLDQLGIAAVGSNGETVKFSVPESGQTENTLTFVLDISTGTWWTERYTHPKFYFRSEDANGRKALFYAQGKRIVQDDMGTNDGVPSGDVTGVVTTGTSTTSVTCSAASFYNTDAGLEECYAHFTRGDLLVGSRRLTSNTGTALTWSATGAGGGNLTVATDDVVHIGPVYWWWKTGNFSPQTACMPTTCICGLICRERQRPPRS